MNVRFRLLRIIIPVLLFLPGAPQSFAASAESRQAVIEDLLSQVHEFLQAYQTDSAMVRARLAMAELSPQIPDSGLRAAVYGTFGRLLIEKGKTDSAKIYLERALAIREKIDDGNSLAMGHILSSMGVMYYRIDDLANAEQYLRRGIAIMEKNVPPDDVRLTRSRHYLAVLLSRRRQFPDAERLYRQVISVFEKQLGRGSPDTFSALWGLAMVLDEQLKTNESEACYIEAVTACEKWFGPEDTVVAQVLQSLAQHYIGDGNYEEGDQACRRVISIWEKAGLANSRNMATALCGFANSYISQDRPTEARQCVTRALAILESWPGSWECFIARYTLASLYEKEKHWDKAEAVLRDILAQVKKADAAVPEDTLLLANIYYSLGDVTAMTGRLDEAEVCIKNGAAYTALYEEPYSANFGVGLAQLASLYVDQKRYHEAESLFQMVLAIDEGLVSSRYVSEDMLYLAVLNVCAGNIGRSIDYFRRAVAMRQRVIDELVLLSSERQKLISLSKYQIVFPELLSMANMYHLKALDSLSLEMILKGKSSVVDIVMAQKKAAFCSQNPDVVGELEQRRDICTIIANLTVADLSRTRRELLSDTLRLLYARLDSLEKDLNRRCADFRDDLAARRFSIGDIAGTIPDDGVVWEFVRYRPCEFPPSSYLRYYSLKQDLLPARYIAFTLTHSAEITLVDLGDAGEIDSLVTLARQMIYDAELRIYSPMAPYLEQRLTEVTSRLYDRIFAPLAIRLPSATEIFISPDGMLNLLPFEILPMPDSTYVIEKYRLSYLATGRDLLRFKAGGKPGGEALILADPDFDVGVEQRPTVDPSGAMAVVSPPDSLPLSRGTMACTSEHFLPLRYGRNEADAVAAAIRTRPRQTVRKLCGADATEGILKRMPRSPWILHLSTHGFFCSDTLDERGHPHNNPLLRSGLALAGANIVARNQAGGAGAEDDGILTGFEVSGLNLAATELAVLSACQTGVGEPLQGEGVFGLRRAFRHAGAQTVVMSLWNVPDRETAEIMSDFYGRWLGGMSKRDALRAATLDILAQIRREKGHGHPLLWGGFVLTGSPD